MKPELKKLLILNAPYLLFVYLFDKIGQAVRLAPGADLSGKVLSLADGFSAAFATPLPSLAPMDLLTPKGNATLVDDYGGNKQLITVTTKGGNYFYILIDRAAEGEQTVHFLNQVDEADLMALTENGEAAKKPEICNCTEKCEVGKVNTSCPVCVTSMTGCTGKEPTPTPTEQPEELKEKGGNPGVVLALVLFALLGGGAAFYYFKFLKPKQNVKGDTDLEDFEFEDYDEDEPEADTGETPEDEETEEETL